MYPRVWAPGHSYTVTISGAFPVYDDYPSCTTAIVSIFANQWPTPPEWWTIGPLATYIHLSKFIWVDSTTSTFDVSVDSDAPTGTIALTYFPGEDISLIWGIPIQPPPPPNPPSPPGPPPCRTPALDPDAPVTPDTWIPGQTSDITVKGTGFTMSANATSNCPATTITIDVNVGKVDYSNIVVVDSTTITAKVTPADTDPGEIATITLWGPPGIGPDVVGHRGSMNAPPSSGDPATVLTQNPLPQISAPVDAMLQAPNSQASSAVLLPQESAPPQVAQVPAAAQPKPESTSNPPNGEVPVATAPAQLAKLYILDPYLPPFNGLSPITENQVMSNVSNQAVQARGIITDGTATAIVVYQLGVNTPVTLTGTDGVRFESWNPRFLTYQPPGGNCGGQCSITVNPIQGNDGSYYAFALMQAPKQSSSVIYTPQAASVTASITINNQKNTSPPVQLGVGPTPVVFVHGLWADATTFDNMSFSLNQSQPWGEGALLYTALSAISYTKVFPFDADAAPNSAKSEL
ncbi:MAG: hypothetical protein WBQ94_16450, partial [Terracidiphilus sp.]